MGLAAAGAVAGIAGGVASVASAGANIAGKLGGASQGSAAQRLSAYQQQEQLNQDIATTTPFIQAGQIAAQQLPGSIGVPMDLSGQPTVANMPPPPAQFQWNPTLAGLQQTPGYQFTLQQGLQAAQNSATARGLGVSGAQLRGASDYAAGLASKTYDTQLQDAINTNQQQLLGYGQQLAGFTAGQGAYQNQFNDYWNNQLNRGNQLLQQAQLGGNVATGQASNATTAASNVGNAVANAGAIQGAGTAGALGSVGNALQSPQVQNGLVQGINYFTGGNYGSSAPGTPGISASGNPVMTGFATPLNIGSPGAYIPPYIGGGSTISSGT